MYPTLGSIEALRNIYIIEQLKIFQVSILPLISLSLSLWRKQVENAMFIYIFLLIHAHIKEHQLVKAKVCNACNSFENRFSKMAKFPKVINSLICQVKFCF